jgi:hypothetical protein
MMKLIADGRVTTWCDSRDGRRGADELTTSKINMTKQAKH